MKIKLTPLILILFVFSQIGLCQSPPGYLGKKNTIGFGLGLIAGIENVDSKGRSRFSNDPEKEVRLTRDLLFNLEYTRTVKRHRSVSLTYRKTRTGVFNNFNAQIVDTHPSFPGLSVRVEGFQKVDISSFGIFYNYFKKSKGYLAPLGRSLILGVRRSSVKPSFVSLNEVDTPIDISILELRPNFSINSLVVGMSQTIIIKDLIYIKPRILLATNFRGLKDYLAIGKFSQLDLQESYEYDIRERITLHEALQLDISAGILF